MQISFYHIGFTNDSYFVIPTLDGKKFSGVGNWKAYSKGYKFLFSVKIV
jgi:hypothetical protein